MGNDICSQAANYCKQQQPSLVRYEYHSIQQPRVKSIILPELDPNVKATLNLKPEYQIQIVQKECFIKKRQFGDDYYEGELNNNGVPHGIGKMYKKDGSLFVGRFRLGVAQGKGLYILNDGAYFEGCLVNNKAECQNGKYSNKLFTYEGRFINNLFNGDGKQYSKNHCFEGIYQNGVKRFGQLKWWYASGKENQYCYYGKFDDNGQFTDEGVLIQPTGTYKGSFLNGKKHGEGIYIYKNNLRYEGAYINGIKQGKGKIVIVEKQQIIYEGGFKDGLPDGQGYKYDDKGQKIQTFFKRGINILNLIDPQSI